VGLPGTAGFVGEILVLVGVYQVNTWVAALAALGVILGAAYMLWLYRRTIFGTLEKDGLKQILDLDRREISFFAPLIVLAILMGVMPGPFLDVMHVSVDHLIQQHQTAMQAAAESSGLALLAAK